MTKIGKKPTFPYNSDCFFRLLVGEKIPKNRHGSLFAWQKRGDKNDPASGKSLSFGIFSPTKRRKKYKFMTLYKNL